MYFQGPALTPGRCKSRPTEISCSSSLRHTPLTGIVELWFDWEMDIDKHHAKSLRLTMTQAEAERLRYQLNNAIQNLDEMYQTNTP